MRAKAVARLTDKDLTRFPVWEYEVGAEGIAGRDETWVVPVTELPVTTLSGRVVGVPLWLGSRREHGLLGNSDLAIPERLGNSPPYRYGRMVLGFTSLATSITIGANVVRRNWQSSCAFLSWKCSRFGTIYLGSRWDIPK